jgi:hypothetical protein
VPDDSENRSEYVGPTTIPPARVPKSEFESVRLAPGIDRRRARTMVSQKAMVRESRKYTWTAFLAGAFGALVASLVYLALHAKEKEEEAEHKKNLAAASAAAQRTGAHPAESEIRRGTVVVDPGPRTAPSAAASALSATAHPSPTEAFPPATVSPNDRAVRTPAPRAPQTPTPPVPSPRSADAPAHAPDGAEASPEPAPGGSSRVWVKPPERKPWVQ